MNLCMCLCPCLWSSSNLGSCHVDVLSSNPGRQSPTMRCMPAGQVVNINKGHHVELTIFSLSIVSGVHHIKCKNMLAK